MDPDECLRLLREAIARFHTIDAMGDSHLANVQAGRAVELIEALDQWCTRGGFPPAAWRPAWH